ncbi:synaptonemal complex protein 2-like [Rhinoraja longicauda]
MPVNDEFTLCTLIEGAFNANANAFQALEEFLLDKSDHPPQQCTKLVLNKLDKLAHKRATEFLKTVELKSNEFLVTLVEDMFDTILAICKCSSEGQMQLMDSFLLQLGHGVTDFRLKINIRLEALRTFNSVLDLISRESKIKFHLSEEANGLMLDLAKTILDVGDYEIQVAISEALCRMTDRKTREVLIYKWFDDHNANAFKEIKDFEFETDCRKFLNRLNGGLLNKRRVYTFPCNSAFLDLHELKMPADDKLENFWIDFNLGSRSVTFFIKDDQDAENDLWETVSLSYESVKTFVVEEFVSATILVINLKGTLLVNKKEGKKVKIYFDSAFDILDTTKLVYGEGKVLVNVDSERVVTEQPEIPLAVSDGELARTSGAVRAEGQRCHSDTGGEHRKSTKKTCNLKSLSPLAASKSGLKYSSDSVVCKDVLPAQTQEVENDEGGQSMDSKEEPTFDEVFTRTTTDESNVKAEKFQVRVSKRKVLGRKASQTDEMQNLNVTSTNRKKSRSEKVMCKRSDVQKFFTEESCSGDSGHSWLAGPRPKARPKSADYSRRRKRRKSELRVLPLSLESSENEGQTKREVTVRKGLHFTPQSANLQPSVGTKMKFKTAVSTPGKDLELLTPPDTLQDKLSSLIKIPRGSSTITSMPANDGASGDVVQQSPHPTSPGYGDDGANMEAGSLTPIPPIRPKRLFTSSEKTVQKEQTASRSQAEMEDGRLSMEDISTVFRSFTEGMRKKLREGRAELLAVPAIYRRTVFYTDESDTRLQVWLLVSGH